MAGVIIWVRRILPGLALAATTLTLPTIAHATVYYISPTGSASNSGTSSSSPWSLGKAMSSLVAGDVCRVLPGAYTGDVVPVNHGTSSARITFVGNLTDPAAATFSGGLECDRSYWSFKGVKFLDTIALSASSATNTARHDSVAWCEARGAHFVGSRNNMVARNRIINTKVPAGATIAFVYSGWQDWPGTGFNSHAERDTLRGNIIDCGVIDWKAFLMRVFAQKNVIDSNQIVARFSGTEGDVQGRYLYNSYYNTFRDNRWTFEADNALGGGGIWNAFSLRDSSSHNLFERDTMLCGLASGFPIYGRMQNAGNASWVGETVRNTWTDCVFRMTGYAFVQMNARGLVLRNTEFSSSNGPAIVFNNGMKYVTVDHCSFYSSTGRAAEFGSIDTSCPPESIRVTNNLFYSRVANSSEGVVKFPGTSGFTSNRNSLFTPSGPDRAVAWTGNTGSVSAWCGASGKDCSSSPGDPRLVQPSTSLASVDLRLGAGSAAIGIGDGGTDAGRYPFGSGGGPDATAPSPVTTLALGLVSDRVATLVWVAPGDDGGSGTAAGYDVRWSASEITASNFGSATAITLPPIPVPGGSIQTYVVLGLTPGTRYWFGLKTRDDANNWSGLSNIASVTTQASDLTPPAAIMDLTVEP